MSEYEEHMAVVSGPHGAEPHREGHYEWHCFCGEFGGEGGEYESRPAAHAAAAAHGERVEGRA
jgi:hypothetical protein